MVEWIQQSITGELVKSLRHSILAKNPPNIEEILISPKYGISFLKNSAGLQCLDFRYVDGSIEKEDGMSKNAQKVRGYDASENFEIINSSVMRASIVCAALLDEDDTHPFQLNIEKDSIEPQGKTNAQICLKSNISTFPKGIYETWMVVVFQFPSMGQPFDFVSRTFSIASKVRLMHVNANELHILTAHSPIFVPEYKRAIFQPPREIVALPNEQLPQYSQLYQLLHGIPEYFPSSIIAKEEDMLHLSSNLRYFFNYKQYYKELLQREEAQMESDMASYDMFDVALKIQMKTADKSQYISTVIDVPGATEGRPVVTEGSIVRLRGNDPPFDQVEIRGVAIRVFETRVTLLLPHDVFGHDQYSTNLVEQYASTYFAVRFMYPREGLRMAYHILQHHTSPVLMNMLHPSVTPLKPLNITVAPHNMSVYNELINDKQFQAVFNILNSTSQEAPYIIYGPPGTGKTITVIESIMQVLSYNPIATVLAVAPSDAAADIVGQRLCKYLEYPKKDLIRLNWPHRKIASVPVNLLNCCYTEEGKGVFSIPSYDELTTFKVIVTTCSLAGILHDIGVEKGYFSHIFIDEACQATEPETTIAMSYCDDRTRVTLAGDPMQLGPSCRATSSYEYHLVESFQERLMRLGMYDNMNPQNSIRITKLTNNYRSHSALIKISSTLFYNKELFACADPRLVDSLCQWEGLHGNYHFPLKFCGIKGEQEQKLDSQSYSNPIEAIKVADIIEELLSSTTVDISTKDISVITPFRQQVLKLRLLLRSRGLSGVNVGTVFNFQGQESKVCILSTVRTSMETVSRDYIKESRQIPVLCDFKTFNVAFTRAMALCIVVGDPIVLSHHPLWSYMMAYCLENHGFSAHDTSDEIIFPVAPPIIPFGQSIGVAPNDPEWHNFM